MADLIRWFHDLEPVERTAAMAIIDDEKFVTFYMNLLRDEQQQSKSGASHALFMIDYLESLYEKASKKKAFYSKEKQGNMTGCGAEQTAGRPSSSNDSSLLSFLSSGRVTGDDTSDFDDPYCMPLIAQDFLNRFPSCSISCRGTEFTPSTSAYLSAEDFGTPTDNSECSRACPGNLGLRSNEFEMNDSALKNESTMKGEEPPYRRTNECLNDNFGLAADLHLAATTSFATSGSGAFDSLFIMRPTTEDSYRLIAIFEELSNSRMFSIRPTFEEIKDSFKGSNKSLPMIGWLAEILRPKEVGINPSSVSYYMLLLSRIELSLWHTFYTSTGCAKPSPSSSIIPIYGNTDVDDEFNTVVGSFNNSVTLLPRARGSKKSKSSGSNRAVPVPVRNSMRVLEISSLQRLSCTAVMLSLGCIIEEHKASWRKMSKVDMLAILSDFPAASTFYSNPTNVRGRSETVVDRLVLCPLLWILDTIAEQDVKVAYRHMEAVITGSSRNSSSNSSSSSCSWNPHARDSTDLTSIPRLGLRSFDENASRTGAMGFILPFPTSSGPVPVEALKESVVEGEDSRVTEHQTVRATPVGLSKRNVARPVMPAKPIPEITVPIAADTDEGIETDKNSEDPDVTLQLDSSIHPPNVKNDTTLVGHTTGTDMVTEDVILVSHLAESTELASSTPLLSCPPSKKALKSMKAKAKAPASLSASQLIKESDIERELESGNESPPRDEIWNAWPSHNEASTVVHVEKDPSPVTIDSFLSTPTEPTGHLSPRLVTALEGFDPPDTLDDALRENEVPTPVLDDVSQLEILSRNTDDAERKCLTVECNPTQILTPTPQSHATLQHPYHHSSLTADQDSVYYESARNSRRGTPDTSDIINALEGYQGTHEEDYESAFLSARISGKERRGSRDSNDSYLTAQRSKRNPRSNRQNNADVLYATYHSGKDSPPRQHNFNNDGSVADYRSNRKVPSIGIVTGGPLFTNRRTPTDRGISSSSSSSIGSFSPADMGDDRAGNYMGQEDNSPVSKKDYYSISSDDRNRERHQQRTNVPELWHLRFDPNSPSQSPRTGNPTSFAVPFGPGGSKSPVSLGSSSPTGIFVDCRPRSRPSTPREELWSHNNVIHHLSSRSMESIGGSQGQVRVQNQNQNLGQGQGQGQSGYGHGLVLTPDRPGRINYESRRYDQNQHQHQQPSHHHHHQMNGNNSNIINNNINTNNSVYNQNNCYNGKINNNNNSNNNNNNNSHNNSNNNNNNNSHNNNSNINNGNLNFNDFNYNTSHQFESNNDQRNRQQIARCRSGPYRGMPTNPRENKDMEFKIKSAQRLQKLLTKNIRSFNNVRFTLRHITTPLYLTFFC